MDFNEWKDQAETPFKYWLTRLSKEDNKLIEYLKDWFKNSLIDYAYTVREDYQNETELHYNIKAQIEDLEFLHKVKAKDLRYASYKNVIDTFDLSKDKIDFENCVKINNDRFIEFVYSFQLLKRDAEHPEIIEVNQIKALEILESFVALNVLKAMISELKLHEINGYKYKRFKDYPEWQLTVIKLGERFNTDLKPTSKFTVIHLFMNDKGLKKGIDNTTYREFVLEYFKPNISFLNFSKGINENHDFYKDNFEQLNHIYKN